MLRRPPKGAVCFEPRVSDPSWRLGRASLARRVFATSSIMLEKHNDRQRIPGGVGHGAHILEDSVAIDVFSPARDDDLRREV